MRRQILAFSEVLRNRSSCNHTYSVQPIKPENLTIAFSSHYWLNFHRTLVLQCVQSTTHLQCRSVVSLNSRARSFQMKKNGHNFPLKSHHELLWSIYNSYLPSCPHDIRILSRPQFSLYMPIGDDLKIKRHQPLIINWCAAMIPWVNQCQSFDEQLIGALVVTCI